MITVKPFHLRAVCACITLVALWSLLIHEAGYKPSEWILKKKFALASSDLSHVNANYRSASWDRRTWDKTSEIGRASNATLGFQKVIVIGMKDRTDKRDFITLAASLTGFEVEFIDGVKPDEIPDRAKPAGQRLKGGALGSWRGHMNAIRSIIDNKYASALILEDDADWDIRLPLQLADFARGTRTLSNISLTSPQLSPYGDIWDVLWPGHCGEVKNLHDNRTYIIENDETVAPKAHQGWLKELKNYPEGTRLIRPTYAPICTFGYAVAYRGAEKIIGALGINDPYGLAIDNELAFLIRDRADIISYVVEPQLFMHHRPAGLISKDSDIHSSSESKAGIEVRKKGSTDMIVWSAKLNIDKMIKGDTNWTTQW